MVAYTLKITLLELDTGRPIPLARIRLRSSDPDHLAQTNSNGYAEFPGLPDIGYSVYIDPETVAGFDIPIPVDVLPTGISSTAKPVDKCSNPPLGFAVSCWLDHYEISKTYKLAFRACKEGTYVALGPGTTINGMTVQLLSVNDIPAPGWAGIKINGIEYDVNVGQTVTTPQGPLTLYALKYLGACFGLPSPPLPGTGTGTGTGSGTGTVTGTGTGTSTVMIPPPPDLTPVPDPALSWNLISVLQSLSGWIVGHLKNILAELAWLVSSMAALIPHVLQLIAYIITLQWLTDFLDKFFDALDTWLSAKFGIDKDKPFFDELMQKVVEWLLSPLDTAAEKRMQGRR